MESEINKIAKEIRSKFTVLIASPTKAQARSLAYKLQERGFENVGFIEKDEEKEPTLIDAIKVLMSDKKNDLGWRVIAKYTMNKKEFNMAVKENCKDASNTFYSFLPADVITTYEEVLKHLSVVAKDEDSVSDSQVDMILDSLNIDYRSVKLKTIKRKTYIGLPQVNRLPTKKIPINVTTVSSSKGLSADFVFLTHFDDQFYIKGKSVVDVTDQDICSFIVALTRARKKVFLISCNKDKKIPLFLDWIDRKRVEKTN